jgi:hypothetical protein
MEGKGTNMLRKTLMGVLTVAGTAALVSAVSAAALGSGLNGPLGPIGIVHGSDGQMTFTTSPANGTATGSHIEYLKPGENVIFSNLGKKYPDAIFSCCGGPGLNGPNWGGGQQWVAGAFTPSSNVTVTRIALGLGYVSGTNSAIVTLNSDDNGLPGTQLASFKIRNIPPSGSCCTLTEVRDRAGTPLTAGEQYWVVATTTADSNLFAIWNQNTTEQIHFLTNAHNNGQGWKLGYFYPGMAFGVFGH